MVKNKLTLAILYDICSRFSFEVMGLTDVFIDLHLKMKPFTSLNNKAHLLRFPSKVT